MTRPGKSQAAEKHRESAIGNSASTKDGDVVKAQGGKKEANQTSGAPFPPATEHTDGPDDRPEEEKTVSELLEELGKTQGPGDSLIVIAIPAPEEDKTATEGGKE